MGELGGDDYRHLAVLIVEALAFVMVRGVDVSFVGYIVAEADGGAV